MTKGIVYYSHLRKDPMLLKFCQEGLKKAANGIKIVSVTDSPLDFGDLNIVYEPKYKDTSLKYVDMFSKILIGLKALDTDCAFTAEDDVLYHSSRFDFEPKKKDIYYYNVNSWMVRMTDGFSVWYDHRCLSGLCADREFLVRHFEKRIPMCFAPDFKGFKYQGFEPGTHRRYGRVDDYGVEDYMSAQPDLDLKNGENATGARWDMSGFRNKPTIWKETYDLPYWGKFLDLYNEFLQRQSTSESK